MGRNQFVALMIVVLAALGLVAPRPAGAAESCAACQGCAAAARDFRAQVTRIERDLKGKSLGRGRRSLLKGARDQARGSAEQVDTRFKQCTAAHCGKAAGTRTSVPACPARPKLAGQWRAVGYGCPDPQPLELVTIAELPGFLIQAVRLRGDDCLGPGGLSWKAKTSPGLWRIAHDGTFPARYQVLRISPQRKVWVDARLRIVDDDTLELTSRVAHITLRRLTPKNLTGRWKDSDGSIFYLTEQDDALVATYLSPSDRAAREFHIDPGDQALSARIKKDGITGEYHQRFAVKTVAERCPIEKHGTSGKLTLKLSKDRKTLSGQYELHKVSDDAACKPVAAGTRKLVLVRVK